jgi:predicted RNA-binding Zn-ribbon protein involved in translation (DUF1610 family)
LYACSRCAAAESPGGFARVCSIAGSIMGDEHVDTLYSCPACGCYTIERYVDRFGGTETAALDGPVTRERGDALVALIKRCETPYDKNCRCPAHLEYFGGGLD